MGVERAVASAAAPLPAPALPLASHLLPLLAAGARVAVGCARAVWVWGASRPPTLPLFLPPQDPHALLSPAHCVSTPSSVPESVSARTGGPGRSPLPIRNLTLSGAAAGASHHVLASLESAKTFGYRAWQWIIDVSNDWMCERCVGAMKAWVWDFCLPCLVLPRDAHAVYLCLCDIA